ncbi:MAG: 16S rRNA (guanine(966)-N(2))-methyltransferase RsmD [Clostridiales bacterium GWD2_32_19]|nr:MAG: 16S rRNA (guanine(966)-N(2))-methyltransferase RsmD [Clostridiales bacterium GWD2_32_19]
MRVISGSARRLSLKTIEGQETRPTLDRIKETLFNIMPMDLIDIDFLDLFSGSGAIGIEALSRYANSAVFVDSNPKCTEIIKENLIHTKLIDRANIYTLRTEDAIKKIAIGEQKFDIIFLDPPYDKGFINFSLKKITECDILKKEGFIIIESSKEETWDNYENLEVYKTKDFKITKITILQSTNNK